MQFSKFVIIYNPNSTGDSAKNARKLQRELVELYPNKTITMRKTKYPKHAEQLAYDAAMQAKKPLIISSSGDGGYSEVINGAMRAQAEGATPICAVLPSGNANDHSRTLQDKEVIDLIKQGKVQTIDLLQLQIKTDNKTSVVYAHSYIGLGLTPVIATELNKTSLNALKEAWIVLRTFFKHRPVIIEHEGKIRKLDSIIFANIGEMAKVLTIAVESKPDDGLFEVVQFTHGHKLRLIRQFLKATITGLDNHKQTKQFAFTVPKAVPAQIDGEIVPLPANCQVTINSAMQLLKTLL